LHLRFPENEKGIQINWVPFFVWETESAGVPSPSRGETGGDNLHLRLLIRHVWGFVV